MKSDSSVLSADVISQIESLKMCEKFMFYLGTFSIFQPKQKRHVYRITILLVIIALIIILNKYPKYFVEFLPLILLFLSYLFILTWSFAYETIEQYSLDKIPFMKAAACWQRLSLLILSVGVSIAWLMN